MLVDQSKQGSYQNQTTACPELGTAQPQLVTKCSSWLVQPSSAELGLALSLIIPTPSPTHHTGL